MLGKMLQQCVTHTNSTNQCSGQFPPFIVLLVDRLRQMALIRLLFLISYIFEWYVVWCGFKKRMPKKTCVYTRDWATCSKHDNHSKFESRHKYGNLQYHHSMSMRIFTLIINEIFIRAPKIMRNVAKASFSICEQS